MPFELLGPGAGVDRHRAVVVDAKACRPVGESVVKATSYSEGAPGIAGRDGPGCGSGCPRNPRGGGMDSAEGRGVPGAREPPSKCLGLARAILHLAETPDRCDVVRRVCARNLLIAGRGRLPHVDMGSIQSAVCTDQIRGEGTTKRRERVLRAEVVGRRRLRLDHEDGIAHDATCAGCWRSRLTPGM